MLSDHLGQTKSVFESKLVTYRNQNRNFTKNSSNGKLPVSSFPQIQNVNAHLDNRARNTYSNGVKQNSYTGQGYGQSSAFGSQNSCTGQGSGQSILLGPRTHTQDMVMDSPVHKVMEGIRVQVLDNSRKHHPMIRQCPLWICNTQGQQIPVIWSSSQPLPPLNPYNRRQ